MTQVKIRPEQGVTLEQLDLPVVLESVRPQVTLESLKRLELATLKALQRTGPCTAARLQATMRSAGIEAKDRSVSSRMSALCRKELVTVVGTEDKQDKIKRRRTVYIYDISEKGWDLLVGKES